VSPVRSRELPVLTVEPSGVRMHSRSRGGEAINFWEIPNDGPVVVHCRGAAFWSALHKTCRELVRAVMLQSVPVKNGCWHMSARLTSIATRLLAGSGMMPVV
jgi:hypothetical protein